MISVWLHNGWKIDFLETRQQMLNLGYCVVFPDNPQVRLSF